MPDEGIFMTNTEDPLGEWKPLVCIREGKGFIDPCPIWDDDGRAYVVHGYAKSRIGFNSKLGSFEINPEGTKCISEDRIIFDGTATQPTIEGPKIYKRDGYYYILAPAGGVRNGWQTVLRSKSLDGPYEEKVVMHQGNTKINGPHQGGLVDTVKGEEWFLHFQDKEVYGRIVHLQPVSWNEGWPIIGIDQNQDGIGEPVEYYRKPDGITEGMDYDPVSEDSFCEESLKLEWQWLANYRDSFYSLIERKGSLCLYPMNTTGEGKALLWNSANVLTQKITCPSFAAETKLDFSALPEGAKAGMLLIGGQYAALYIERQKTGYVLGYLESEGTGDTRTENVIQEFQRKDDELLMIQIRFHQDGTGEFRFRGTGQKWSKPTRSFSPKGAVWVGAKIGLFAISNQDLQPGGRAFFNYFKVTAISDVGI
jgi:beta-xylosidase